MESFKALAVDQDFIIKNQDKFCIFDVCFGIACVVLSVYSRQCLKYVELRNRALFARDRLINFFRTVQ